MDNSNIFIVGANGQLGIALREKYPTAQFADIHELDITDRESVNNFDWSEIGIIINAAAYTNVDAAETPAGRVAAWNVNAVAVSNLASVCLQYGITLVHISSDYVFDGTKKPHLETEMFTPLGVYGQTKAAGDIVAGLLPKHYILRATWVIGEGRNFVRTMLELAKKGISPTVVADQVGRLTFTSELVRIINHLLMAKAPYGTYNATNDGAPASWADITRKIFSASGYKGLVASDTTTEEYFRGKDSIAPRPLNSEMDLTKLHATGFQSHDWHDELKFYIVREKEAK